MSAMGGKLTFAGLTASSDDGADQSSIEQTVHGNFPAETEAGIR
jgi:hypothetical protein